MQIYTIKENSHKVLTNIIRYMGGGVTFINYFYRGFVLKFCLSVSHI